MIAQSDKMMKLMTDLNDIGQQFCQNCTRTTTEYLSDPGSDVGDVTREHVRAARNAVDEALGLQLTWVQDWRSELMGKAGLWAPSHAALAAMESAIGTRSEFWQLWFKGLEVISRQGADTLRRVPHPRTLTAFMPEPPAEAASVSPLEETKPTQPNAEPQAREKRTASA